MTVHLLKERTGKVFVAKCGHRVELKRDGRQPDEFTVWGGRVTCPEC